MKKIIWILILLVIFLLILPVAFADTYYVCDNSADCNSGAGSGWSTGSDSYSKTQAKNKATPIFIDVTSIHPFEIENFYDTIFTKTIQAFKENKKLPIKINVLEALRSMTSILDIIKKPEISLNIKEYLEIKIAFKEGKTNLQELLNKSFSLIENLSKETKTKAILILDEFQLVQDLEENINELWEAVKDYNSVWLILQHEKDKKELIAKTLIECYDKSYHRRYKHWSVYLFKKNNS